MLFMLFSIAGFSYTTTDLSKDSKVETEQFVSDVAKVEQAFTCSDAFVLASEFDNHDVPIVLLDLEHNTLSIETNPLLISKRIDVCIRDKIRV